MTRPVHIVATAARTAVGLSAESSAAAVRAGISRVCMHAFLVDLAGDEVRCAADAVLEPALLGARRLVALAEAGLSEITAKLIHQSSWSAPVKAFLALPELRPGFKERDVGEVARALSAPRPGTGALEVCVEANTSGHVGALRGLEDACMQIERGQSELCVIGGVDSYLDSATIGWLDGERRLAREGIRGGFFPGEAAAWVALASEQARARLALRSLATVRVVATDLEQRDPNGSGGLMGEAMSRVLARVATTLRPREQLENIFCDINGERMRTDDWGLAVLRAGALLRDGTGYHTPVAQLGDVGAASGALNCVLATQAWQRGYARANTALVWGASWGGLRAAALLDKGA